ncbi:MAG: SMP-30/gluconolactonase/LRE family protein [Sneathiella sp.]
MKISTSQDSPTAVWPAGAKLGEGPVWVDTEKALYWVDIKGCMIHRLSWPDVKRHSWKTHCQIGALHPTSTGRFIGAFADGIHYVRLDKGHEFAQTELIVDPEEAYPNNRFNDGKIGPNGDFWTGSMDDGEANPTGHLYKIAADGQYAVLDKDYVITNGPAFSPDGKTLYHTDTLGRVIYAFDLSPSGTVSAKRPFIRIPPENGYPDGMCVDEAGYLWVCHWGGWGITRYSPEGEETGRIEMPVANVTSCAFGGIGRNILFITTATKGLTKIERSRQLGAGALFAIELDVRGPATRYFQEADNE